MSEEKKNQIAIEDLVTVCIESFLTNLKEFGCNKEDIVGWYFGLSEDEKYNVSDKLIDIEQNQYEKWKEQNES